MMNEHTDAITPHQETEIRQGIEKTIERLFAVEDAELQAATVATKQAGLSTGQISPIQGKLLYLLALVVKAHKILEIGTLGGYSGIWLARALPPEGRLITLEVKPEHAEIAHNNFLRAGIQDRSEIRIGKALDLLPHLEQEAPFDLVFIDADKAPYPLYLDWALRLTHSGSIIVADNCIWEGEGLGEPKEGDTATSGIVEYNKRIRSNSRLTSLILALDDDYTDGFAISLVN